MGNSYRNIFMFMPLLMALLCLHPVCGATDKFLDVHHEKQKLSKDVVLKKLLFVSGLVNATYLGLNDLVAALQLAKNSNDEQALSAQLFSVQVGLVEKPALIRYIADEIKFCEKYPNFPLGFNDSPEGPEKLSQEFYKIADHLEKMKINYKLKTLPKLRKEAERVVFEIFWTECEKMRTMSSDMLNFIRIELKEDLPLNIFSKPVQDLY